MIRNMPLLATRSLGGFTIIELMIAVAVLAVTLSLGVPAFTDMFDRHRLKTVAETAYQDLQFARSEAIKRNETVRVNFTAAAGGNPWCYGMKDGATTCDCNETDPTETDYCEVGNAPKSVSGDDYRGVDLDSASFSGNSFTTFDPRRGTASAGTVTFDSSEGYSADIAVSALGRVRLCSDDPALGYPGC